MYAHEGAHEDVGEGEDALEVVVVLNNVTWLKRVRLVDEYASGRVGWI